MNYLLVAQGVLESNAELPQVPHLPEDSQLQEGPQLVQDLGMMQQEIDAAFWLGPLLLFVTLLCVTAWYFGIFRLVTGKEPVPYEERKSVPWGIDGAALAAMALISSAIALISSPTVSSGITYSKAIEYASISGLLVILMVGWQRMQVCASWTDFGLPSTFRQFGSDTFLGIMTFAAALLPVYAVQFVLVSLLNAPSSHQVIESLLNDPSGEMLLSAFLIAVVVAPLFEEFVFRVMLQGWFEKLAEQKGGTDQIDKDQTDQEERKNLKSYWPILASSFAFAIAHTGQGYAPVALFVLACFLGYLYRQTHRIAPCVVAHMVFNAFSLAIAYGTVMGASVNQ